MTKEKVGVGRMTCFVLVVTASAKLIETYGLGIYDKL